MQIAAAHLICFVTPGKFGSEIYCNKKKSDGSRKIYFGIANYYTAVIYDTYSYFQK